MRLSKKFDESMHALTGLETRLLKQIFVVSRATIKGTLVIALIQGEAGGIAFYFAGIPSPIFWAVMMGILSLIPIIGPPLIWAPVAAILILNGQVTTGILLLAWGGIFISNIDNVLRPILVGTESGLPDIIVLVSTLGGIATLGGIGIVLGSVLAAITISMLNLLVQKLNPGSAPVKGEIIEN